jgi:hypothetical protein
MTPSRAKNTQTARRPFALPKTRRRDPYSDDVSRRRSKRDWEPAGIQSSQDEGDARPTRPLEQLIEDYEYQWSRDRLEYLDFGSIPRAMAGRVWDRFRPVVAPIL